jgi:molecular chaperone DnaK (HSP70)
LKVYYNFKTSATSSKIFQWQKLCRGVDPDEAITYRAAVQVAIIIDDIPEEIKDIFLLDLASINFGYRNVR